MGIIKRGILGGVANKIGNVVGSSWKGIATLRSLPLSVANPNTIAQRTNRKSFAIMSKLGSQVLATVCQPLWNRDAKQMSGFNAYVMTNKRAYDEDWVAWLANPIMSKGNLSATLQNAGINDEGANLMFIFDSVLKNPQDSRDDIAYVQVIHQDNSNPAKPAFYAKGFITTATRSEGHVQVTNPFEPNEGDKLIMSLSFKSVDGREVATSSSVVIAL
jgi:hypothetical protein